MAWRAVTDWHLTKGIAEDTARDFRKRYPVDKFRVRKGRRNWEVQVWDTSIVPVVKGR